MKLTIVNFSGRMIGKDKGAIYKEATFLDSIQVIDIPSENADLQVERHKLPTRATLLTCADKLVVWSHKKPNEPNDQHMQAFGNAYLRNEEYDGWGETIENNGKLVIFDGMGLVPARIKGRFNGNDQSGKRIIYDRATNHYKVEGSVGGTITQGGTGAKPLPSPKK
jgi:lipopolysaccharide export system protein LptA